MSKWRPYWTRFLYVHLKSNANRDIGLKDSAQIMHVYMMQPAVDRNNANAVRKNIYNAHSLI